MSLWLAVWIPRRAGLVCDRGKGYHKIRDHFVSAPRKWETTLHWMRPANERRRYNVTLFLIGWAHSQNDSCKIGTCIIQDMPMLVQAISCTVELSSYPGFFRELHWILMGFSEIFSPDSKVHGANIGPTWVLSAPDGPHVGPLSIAIKEGNLDRYELRAAHDKVTGPCGVT